MLSVIKKNRLTFDSFCFGSLLVKDCHYIIDDGTSPIDGRGCFLIATNQECSQAITIVMGHLMSNFTNWM